MLLFGKNSKRARMIEDADVKFNKFKEEIKDVPLEKNDYLAMVLGAFWALWPVLAVVVGIIAFVLFFFFR
ncbi:hypothetical protein DW709_07485 [Coprococcus sp. AM27-12LB]|nr:hypothetical protein DW709_07485 [Coprococcus sp. AM27-12LB]